MKQISNQTARDIVKVLSILLTETDKGSTRYANAVRVARLLINKLQKL